MRYSHEMKGLLVDCIRLRRSGEYRKAYDRIRGLMRIVRSDHAVKDGKCIITTYLEHARCSYYLSRFRESESILDDLDSMLAHAAGKVHDAELESSIIRSYIFRRTGRYHEAKELLTGRLRFRRRHRPSLVAEGLLSLGECHFYLKEMTKAEECLEGALGLASHQGDQRTRARVLLMLGLVSLRKGLIDSGADYCRRAGEIHEALNDRYGEAATLLNLGISLYRQGKLGEAEKSAREARSSFLGIPWLLGAVRADNALGRVKYLAGDLPSALRHLRRSKREAIKHGFVREAALSLILEAEIHIDKNDCTKAAQCLKDALKSTGGLKPSSDVIPELFRCMGELSLARGNTSRATRYLNKALHYSKTFSDALQEGLSLRALGMIAMKEGRCGDSDLYFKQALGRIHSASDTCELAKTHLLYAEGILASMKEGGERGRNGGAHTPDVQQMWDSAVEADYLFRNMESRRWKERAERLVDGSISIYEKFKNERQRAAGGRKMIEVRFNPSFVPYRGIAAISGAMLKIFDQVRAAARTSHPVLITGETGTGKELVANLVHMLSERSERAFIPVNCAAVPDHLFESEFFGYRKGCFTGAFSDRRGLFEEANGGTLFLDEIGELTNYQQVKLLRILQEGKVRRIGDNIERPIDIRIVAATNQDLTEKMRIGTLREDFYYRINTECIHVPPLRERPEDLLPLISHFFGSTVNDHEAGPVSIEAEALQALQAYSWPGNVRELYSMLTRINNIGGGPTVTMDLLPSNVKDAKRPGAGHSPYHAGRVRFALTRKELEKALALCNGNKSEVARLFGISRCTLYKKLKIHGL